MLTTMKSFRPVMSVFAAVVMALVFVSTIAATPAHASENAPYLSTPIVDVLYAAKNATWTDRNGNPQKGLLNGDIQVSGFYPTTDGTVVTSSIPFDLSHWRVSQAIYEQAAAGGKSNVELGSIEIAQITVIDSDHPNGMINYKLATVDAPYALVRPGTPFTSRPLSMADQEPTIGKKYFIAMGDRRSKPDPNNKNLSSRYSEAPVTVTGKAVGTDFLAYSIRGSSINKAPSPIGGFAFDPDGGRLVISVVTEDPGDAGSLLLLTNASLRQFMTKNGLSLGASTPATPSATATVSATTAPTASMTPSESPSETASSQSPSAAPSATSTRSIWPIETTTAVPAQQDRDGNMWAATFWFTIAGLAAVALIVVLVFGRRKARSK